MKLISTLFLALSMLAAAAPAADTANDLFQQALVKERTEGNLPEAIKLYQHIVDKYANNHKVAAEALLQLAGCQSKLGDAQARKSLERLVRDFADQKETVAEARVRLAALGGGGQAEQLSTKLVWGSPKSDGDSLSPDGRYLSYTDWDTGNLMLHDFVAGADRALTTAGGMKSGEQAYAEGSAISRDGKQIAYGWWDAKVKRFELRVANLDGEPNPRRLFESSVVIPSAWSPDGKWIAASVEQRDGNKSTWQIGLINAQDGSLRTLKSVPQYPRVYRFSPDGKYILYSQRTPDNVRAYILSLDGKSDVPLVSEAFPVAGSFPAQSPVWTPDGSRIVFGAPLTRASSGLWSVRVADGTPVGAPEPFRGDIGGAYPIGFTPDWSLIYRADGWQSDIYVAGLDPVSGKLTSEPKHVNERTPGQSWQALAWLPDGKSLSYFSRRNGRDAVVVHTLATHEERELWTIDIGAGGPGVIGWFPDGSMLTGQVSGQNKILRRVDSRTLEARASWTVSDWQSKQTKAFSRDLMSAFFPRKDEAVPCDGATCTYAVIARDFATGRDREVFRLEAVSITGPSISPDGRDLAFIAMTRTGRALMVAPTAGGAPSELYRGPGVYDSTAWTQDGAHVLVFSNQSGKEELWSFPTKGGPPEQSPIHMHTNGVVSPDGTQIAFVASESKTGIWSMTGLFPDVKPAPAR